MKLVLFVCIHNSARSQMAEAFANHFSQGRCAAESAGLKPGLLNPLAVEVMREAGIDISANKTKSVEEMLKLRKRYDYVVTVCDEANARQCPTFPGVSRVIPMAFADPAAVDGTYEERLTKVRGIRDQIKRQISDLLLEIGPAKD